MDTKSGYCKINSYCQGQSIEKVANQCTFRSSQNFIKENLEGGLPQTEGTITKEVFASLIILYGGLSRYIGANLNLAAYAKLQGLDISEIQNLSSAINKNLSGESSREKFELTNKLLTFLTGEKGGANLTSSVKYLEGLGKEQWETLAEVFKKLEPGFVGFTDIRKGLTFADKLSSEYGVTTQEFIEGFLTLDGTKVETYLKTLKSEDVKTLGVILAKLKKKGYGNPEAIFEKYGGTDGKYKTVVSSFVENGQIDDFLSALKDDETILDTILSLDKKEIQALLNISSELESGQLITFLKNLNALGANNISTIINSGKDGGKAAAELLKTLGKEDYTSLIQTLTEEAKTAGTTIKALLASKSTEELAKLGLGQGQEILDLLKLLGESVDIASTVSTDIP